MNETELYAFQVVQGFIDEANELLKLIEKKDIDGLMSAVSDIREMRETMVRHYIIKNILWKST